MMMMMMMMEEEEEEGEQAKEKSLTLTAIAENATVAPFQVLPCTALQFLVCV